MRLITGLSFPLTLMGLLLLLVLVVEEILSAKVDEADLKSGPTRGPIFLCGSHLMSDPYRRPHHVTPFLSAPDRPSLEDPVRMSASDLNLTYLSCRERQVRAVAAATDNVNRMQERSSMKSATGRSCM